MYGPTVAQDHVLACTPKRTEGTGERPLPSVGPHVTGEVTNGLERGSVAVGTYQGPCFSLKAPRARLHFLRTSRDTLSPELKQMLTTTRTITRYCAEHTNSVLLSTSRKSIPIGKGVALPILLTTNAQTGTYSLHGTYKLGFLSIERMTCSNSTVHTDSVTFISQLPANHMMYMVRKNTTKSEWTKYYTTTLQASNNRLTSLNVNGSKSEYLP